MFGVIDAYNEVHGIGLIRSTADEIFSFGMAEWDAPRSSPKLKMEVQFDRAPPGAKWKKAHNITPVLKTQLDA